MRAVLGLLLLFAGAELIFLVVTGKLGNTTSGGTGGGPDDVPVSGRAAVGPAISVASWGTHPIKENMGGLLP